MTTTGTKRRKRILLAEDDPSIRDLLVRSLEPIYDVVVAQDGHEAVARIGGDERFDLVLLDVMMPGVDGFGVAARMKMVPGREHVPLIFLTAKDGPLDVVQGIRAGARHYITKPFKIADLLDKVRRATGG